MIEVTNKNSIFQLTKGSLLARNIFINLIGQGAPLLVAIIAIPIIIKDLGTERFGVLTLAWMVIGYFSLFDLGLGRSLTKLVAEKLGAGQEERIPAMVWTCLFLMLIFGIIGALLVGLSAPWLVHHVLKIPKALQNETLQAFYLLAFSISIVISTTGFIGILEAHQRFGLINVVRTTIGVLTYLSPLLVLPFSQSLFPIVAVLTGIRLLAWLVYIMLCFYIMPDLHHGIMIQRSLVRSLLSFGGWITVSNIVSPLMTYLDRFLIGALLSMAAVAYYVTPYEAITKLWIFPTAVANVLFPAFSTSFFQDSKRTALIFGGGVKCVFLALFPISLFIVAMAQDGLNLWLGKEFVQHSTYVLQWLTIGVFINSLARIPFALIQGVGRPDLTAKLNFIELPFYLIGVWWAINAYGIEGAAIAWSVRVAVDMVILFGMALWLMPDSATVIKRMTLIIAVALLTFGFFAIFPNRAFLLLMLPTFVLSAWFLILTAEDRIVLHNFLKIGRVFK